MRKTIPTIFIFLVFLFPFVLSSCYHMPTSVLVDSDKDGVPDNYDYRYDFTTPQYYDKCPTTTPIGAKVDKYGCSLDTDEDGVPDDLDKCPGTPKGVKINRDGCPLDSDGDGVPDYLDKCPGTPMGVKIDRDGCPLDSDGNGVPDYLDKCPGTPKGGAVDQDGCPLQEEKERVTLNVEFDTDKSIVKKEYNEKIGKLAAVMKKYPDLIIALEGHTDNVGGAAYNDKLSQRRVDAVKKYMVEKFGIETFRLSVKGYGLTRPIASNATKEGRQKNRRVEAVVEYGIKK